MPEPQHSNTWIRYYSLISTISVKRVIAYRLEEMMKERHLTKKAMAERMHASRAALDRLLDPTNVSVTLQTLERAALALGRRLKIELA